MYGVLGAATRLEREKTVQPWWKPLVPISLVVYIWWSLSSPKHIAYLHCTSESRQLTPLWIITMMAATDGWSGRNRQLGPPAWTWMPHARHTQAKLAGPCGCSLRTVAAVPPRHPTATGDPVGSRRQLIRSDPCGCRQHGIMYTYAVPVASVLASGVGTRLPGGAADVPYVRFYHRSSVLQFLKLLFFL